MSHVRARRNLAQSTTEGFRPPLFRPNTSWRNRLENRLRRFLDLQMGTIWRDLRPELATAQGSVLDIGCGAQVYRDLVPDSVAYQGIDTQDAQARFEYSVPDTQYFAGDDWGVPEASFDTALCTEVLEHIPDPVALLARTWRCLRPGGRLLLTVPFAARWHFIPHDYWRYTPSGLHLLLTAAGFEDIHIAARGTPVTVACYKAMALLLGLLFGSDAAPPSAASRLVGVACLPVLGLLAALGNLSLLADHGDDCLGYTVIAQRPR